MLKKRNTFRQLAHNYIFQRIHGSKLIYNTYRGDADINRNLMQLDCGGTS